MRLPPREISLKNLTERVASIALLGLALSLPGAARATLVQALTLPEMVHRSATIVHGTVLETHTEWEEGTARLYTYVTLSASELLKGGPRGVRTITFRQLGGRDGDRIVYVPGTPRFAAMQEVLVFLTANDGGGYPQVMGIFQGAFRPIPGPEGERRIVGLSSDAAASLRPERGSGGSMATPASPLEGSFTGFLERVRALVRGRAAISAQ